MKKSIWKILENIIIIERPVLKTLRTARILILMFFVGCFIALASNSYSQNTDLTLNMNEASIRSVLNAIEDQSEFHFLYSTKVINVDQDVDIQSDNKDINFVLNQLLAGTGIKYMIDDRNVMLFKENTDTKAIYQPPQVSGKITDAANFEPLAGVTIQVKGTLTGTISQIDGTYTVSLPAEANTLIFSFVGYQTEEIEIGGRTVIDLAMQEEITALEEVVITGYSTERKKDIIGSVAVVNTTELLSTPAGSVTNQLQGRAPGVTISGSGEPGKSARVRIRGFGTFGESEPLYIIDGVPSNVNRLNPNDVESVQVLKDAASAAVYGARAANGVIIITTKQGSPGKAKVSFDSYYGLQYIGKKWYPDVLNAKEWGEMFWEAMENAGLEPGDPNWFNEQYGTGPVPVIPEYILVNDNGTKYGGTSLEYLRQTDIATFNDLVNPDNYDFETHQIVKAGDTDWAEEMYDAAPIQNHQLTVSGGTEQNSYLFSINYFDQISTVTEYSFFKRYSLRANTSFSPYDRIRFGENVQVGYERGRDVSYTNNAWTFHPLIPLTDIKGGIASSAAPGLVMHGGQGGMNPVLGPGQETADYNENISMFGNVFGELEILKDLTVRSTFGFDIGHRVIKDFYPLMYQNAEPDQPHSDRLLYYTTTDLNWVFTNTATYSKTLGQHVFKILVGTEAVNNLRKTINVGRYTYTAELQEFKEFLELDSGTGLQINDGTEQKSTLFSVFGRIDYTYADKYILNATVRRDGSSKFGSNNRYGVFPSVAIGWRISQEPFMQNLTWLTDLKLRASTGVIGNQSGLDPDNQYDVFTGRDWYNYNISGAPSVTAPSYALTRIGNPDARWEKTKTSNVGLDATLLQGRISFSGEYYERVTNDLLVQNQAPLTGSQAIQPYINVGSIRNRGIEFNASYRGTAFGDLGYEVSANFTRYKNKVLKVMDNEAATITVGHNRTEKGEEMAYFYGFIIDGFFNTQAEVDAYTTTTYLVPRLGGWRIKDLNNDGAINDFDRTKIGTPHPDFQMNFSLSLYYKNFDLFATVLWNQGGDLYFGRSVDQIETNNSSKRLLYDSWRPDHMNAKLPRLNVYDATSFAEATTYSVEDATYVRVRTVQLGYTIPASITSKLRIENLRIYIQSQNPFTWCKEFSGMDPDAAYSGNLSGAPSSDTRSDFDYRASDLEYGNVGGQTPTPQQILFGVNLTF